MKNNKSATSLANIKVANDLINELKDIPIEKQGEKTTTFIGNDSEKAISAIKGLYAIITNPNTTTSEFEAAYLAARQLQPFLKTEMLAKASVIEAINPIYAIITESENSELINYDKSLKLRELVSDLTFRLPTLGNRIGENLNIKGVELNPAAIPTLQQLAESVVDDIEKRSNIKKWIQFTTSSQVKAAAPTAQARVSTGYKGADPVNNPASNIYGTLPLSPQAISEMNADAIAQKAETVAAEQRLNNARREFTIENQQNPKNAAIVTPPSRPSQKVMTYNLQNRESGSGEAQTADFPTPPTGTSQSYAGASGNAEGNATQYPSSDIGYSSARPHSDATGETPFYGLKPRAQQPESEDGLPIAHVGHIVPPTVHTAVITPAEPVAQVAVITQVVTDPQLLNSARRNFVIEDITPPTTTPARPAVQYETLPADPATREVEATTKTTNEDTTANNSAVKANHPLVLTNELNGFKSNKNNEINKVILGSLLANLGVKPDDIDLLISQVYADGLKTSPQTVHLVRMRTMVESIVAKTLKPLDGKTLNDAEKKELYGNINASIREKADNVIRKVGLKSIHHSGFIGENYNDINAINSDGMQRGNKLFEEGLNDSSSWKKTIIDSFSDDKTSDEYAELIRKKHINLAVNKPEAFSFMGKLKLFGGLGGAGAAMYLLASFFPALLPLVVIGKLLMVFSAISVVIAGIGEAIKGLWELIKGLVKVVAGITKLAVGAVTLTIDLVKSPVIALMNRGREQENKIEYFNFTKKAMSAIDTGISTILGEPKDPKTLYKPKDESKYLANRDGLKDRLEQISVSKIAVPTLTQNPTPPALTQPTPAVPAITPPTRPAPTFTSPPTETRTRSGSEPAPRATTTLETARPRADSAPAVMNTTTAPVATPPATGRPIAPQTTTPTINPMNTIANMAGVTGTGMFNTGPIGSTNKIYDTVPADTARTLQGAMSAQPPARDPDYGFLLGDPRPINAAAKPPVPPVPGGHAARATRSSTSGNGTGGIGV